MNEITKAYKTIIFNSQFSESTLKEFQLLVVANYLKTKFNDPRSLYQLRLLIKDELKV